MPESLLAQLWASVLRLLPSIVTAIVVLTVVWLAARYPAVPEGVEERFWRRYSRRFWRKRREGKR
jgi:hypothetical protein